MLWIFFRGIIIIDKKIYKNYILSFLVKLEIIVNFKHLSNIIEQTEKHKDYNLEQKAKNFQICLNLEEQIFSDCKN